jgi:hypothetical protein
MRLNPLVALFLASAGLSGCNLFGGESAEAVAARREADGKAIGGACRHAGRAIEDCYLLNRRADKSAMYAGWREMNDYMRENNLDPVAPQLAAEAAVARSVGETSDSEGRKTANSVDKAADRPRGAEVDKATSASKGAASEKSKKHES